MHLSDLSIRHFALALLVSLALPASLAHQADAGDWPNRRGPQHNNSSTETGLIEKWKPKGGSGSNLLWKSKELAGISTPIVMNGRIYTLTRDQPGTELEGEKVVCADAATGKVLWEHRINVYLSDVPDTRVGWSSVVGDPETGRVYAQGVSGYFCCLEGETGKPVWERSLHEELGLLSTYGGRTNTPIVYKDTVITSAVVIGWGDTPQWGLLAKPAHRFMSFDKATGELRWLSGTRLIPFDTTYSTPALVSLYVNHEPVKVVEVMPGKKSAFQSGGIQDLLVFGSGDGQVWGMQAGTGKTVWNVPLSRRGLNVSPVVTADGRVFTGQSEENLIGSTMGSFIAIDGTKTGPMTDEQLLWKNYEVMAGKSSPLFIDEKVYVVTDSAKMLVFDAKTGEELERKALGRVSRGTPVYADGKIYYCSRGGRFYILKPNADGTLDTVFKTSLRGEQVDASPIVANGRVYLTTSEYVYCLGDGSDGKPEKESPTDIRNQPSGPAQAAEVAQVVLSPYDVLLKPSDRQKYTVRLYNVDGDLLREAAGSEIEFSVAGPGEVSADGQFTAPASAADECALVTAKVGELTANARVRIVPPLPWNFTFDNREEVPLTWVGGRIRYNLRKDNNGNGYLAKPIELPTRPGAPTTKLGTRSQMWMGSPELSDYTVQADVQMQSGTPGESSAAANEPAPEFPTEQAEGAVKLPSVGLINSGYTFTLFGPSNEARVYSWCTHDKRTQETLGMKFEPGVWYTMKLKVHPEPEEGHNHVYAKIWKRGETEPSEWTMTFEDDQPINNGSPGLFGDAKEAEFYVDNLMVTPN